MADEDVQMPDAPTSDAPGEPDEHPSTSQVVESIEDGGADVKGENDNENDNDNENAGDNSDAGDDDGKEETHGRPVSNKQYKALKAITEVLSEYKIKKGNDDYYPSLLFRRVPNKRNLPDYYQIIKEPSAISTLKGKIQRKTYSGIPEFVRDFALVVHNAQVYNRPNSQPVRDIFVLDAVFKEELKKLVEQGLAKEEETPFPDLGEIPAATPEPDPVSEEEEEEGDEEGEEDDEDEDGDDSDEGTRRRRRRGGRQSGAGRKAKDDDDDKDDARKRRGRPPKVDTPMEARIKAIIKGLRKPKDDQGVYRLRHFERLPDNKEHPHYYQEIKEPIAMDLIKRKAKRKKYNSLEHFLKDIELMLKNAMRYNEDSSEITQDAIVLLKEVQELAQIERAKPDSEYSLDDGRIPLPNGVEYKGEIWKVGDWIHIQNPNDVTKPIVAQIYRTWRDPDGQNWINACWYYRPEQTIHQYEKHFYPNEVVKTGQYRDHHIEEVIDRCFVMFFTRYNRGRPRNLDPSREVYVCEARYNEEKHKFNKIKTWASCLPDEVRDKDYEMDLFDMLRRIKKVPSPIKHMLKDDATENDGLPTPQWGNKNAPPILGGVHKGPRDENQSPPPEPTPPPPPTPPPAAVRPLPNSLQMNSQSRPVLGANASNIGGSYSSLARASPAAAAQHPYQASPSPALARPPLLHHSTSGHSFGQSPVPQTPIPGQPSYQQQPQLHPTGPFPTQQQPTFTPHQYTRPATIQQHQAQTQAAQNLAHAQPQPVYQQHQQPQQPPQQNYAATHNAHAPYPAVVGVPGNLPPTHRDFETYVLSDTANASIPKDIRDQFPQDDQGRVLFFTRPPIDTRHLVTGRSAGEKGKPLRHSEAYLKAKENGKHAKLNGKSSDHGSDDIDGHSADEMEHQHKRIKVAAALTPGSFGDDEVRDEDGRIRADPTKASGIPGREEMEMKQFRLSEEQQNKAKDLKERAMKMLQEGMIKRTAEEYVRTYGSDALKVLEKETQKRGDNHVVDAEGSSANDTMEDTKKMLGQNFWTGKFKDGTGRWEDDFDNRLSR